MGKWGGGGGHSLAGRICHKGLPSGAPTHRPRVLAGQKYWKPAMIALMNTKQIVPMNQPNTGDCSYNFVFTIQRTKKGPPAGFSTLRRPYDGTLRREPYSGLGLNQCRMFGPPAPSPLPLSTAFGPDPKYQHSTPSIRPENGASLNPQIDASKVFGGIQNAHALPKRHRTLEHPPSNRHHLIWFPTVSKMVVIIYVFFIPPPPPREQS